MITVQSRRAEALHAGYLSLAGRISMTFEDFARQLESWDVRAFCDGERVIGMLMTKGPELHVAVLPEVRGKWLSRRLIREVFAPIEREFGSAKTKVAQGNAVGHDFVERIRRGFASLEFDPTTALISAGTSLLGGALQGDAAKSAASTQANAANQATAAQLQMFNTQNTQQAPYRQLGTETLGTLGFGAGIPGYPDPTAQLAAPGKITTSLGEQTFTTQAELRQHLIDDYVNQTTAKGLTPNVNDPNYQAQLDQAVKANWAPYAAQAGPTPGTSKLGDFFTHQFNAEDLNANLAPNYQFMLDQGTGATRNALNASGGALSGNTLKGITDYATNFAKNAYQNAFANYTANQSNIFNRLSTIAGFGSAANTATSNLTGTLAPAIAGTTQAAGTATAGGIVGQANALSGGVNNALGWYNLGNLLKPTPSGGDLAGQGVG